NRRSWLINTKPVRPAAKCASRSSLLVLALDKNDSVPLGTFITWAGLIALPLMCYWSAADFRNPKNTIQKVFSGLIKLVISLAVLWVPISYVLSGNLAFNFSETSTFKGGQSAMKLFWVLTYGIVLATTLIMLSHFLTLIFKKLINRKR
ncbi:MAG: hypothetical protein AAF688_12685, partial [Bacteroidota bacterium]